jgi:cytochrome d ubiquinol oxidase subunit II
LGACWLYWRTVGELQRRSGLQAKMLAIVTVVLLIVLVVWTATLDTRYAQRLTDRLVWMPAVMLLAALLIGFALGFRSRRHFLPLFCALGVFILAFALMIAALFPMIVPPKLTLQAAASSPNSQIFMLVGFVVLIPVTLIYNTYGFSVFSGKVRADRD